MKDIECKIREILSQDIKLPSEYKHMIRNTLKETVPNKIYMKNRIFKVLATACVSLIVATSIVYAKDISNFIYHFFNNNRGLDLAVNEGYIDEPNAEYITPENIVANDSGMIIDASNTEIKVTNMLMDDYNLSFTFSVKLDDNIDISRIASVWFPDILITDENNNILICTEKYLFEDYCSKHSLDYKYDEFNEHHMNSGCDVRTKTRLSENHTTEITYNFKASVYPYPKSKKLYIYIPKINMSKDISYKQIDVVLNGDWKINFDVAEKFYNRESIIYAVKSCSDEKINVTEACVYNTGMVLEFTSKVKPIWNKNDSSEVISQKLDQFLKYEDNIYTNGLQYINEEFIVNEKGEIFKPVESGLEGGQGTTYGAYGDFIHWQTFDLITSKATKNLTVHVNVFLDGYQRDVVIELERQ